MHVAHIGKKFSYKVVRKSEQEMPLRGSGRMWEDDIKMGPKEMG
jgi:hypothetical protein